MEITAFDPALQARNNEIGVKAGHWPDHIHDLDYLIFSAPLTPDTHHMFHGETLHKIKPGLRLVNVGRGPVVCEKALIKGLDAGLIHSAALDVFEEEPLNPNSHLRQFDRCIFGSHNGSNTIDAVHRVSHMAIDRLFHFLGVR